MEDMMGETMDPKLVEAVLSGDVSFLKATLDACQPNGDYSCLLSRRTKAPDYQSFGNILHVAAWNGRENFFREAVHLIPNQIVQRLLSYQEPSARDFNPLHVAAYVGHLGIIKLIYGFYTNSVGASSNDISKPWLAKEDTKGSTPLHVALGRKKEECALEILSVDSELLCNMVDKSGNSPLFLAVQNGLSRVALQILKSERSYSVSGEVGRTPLHVVPNCSGYIEEVCSELLKWQPVEFIIKATDKDGYTALHQWLLMGNILPFEYIVNCDDIAPEIKSSLVDLLWVGDNCDDNPFHIAVDNRKFGASKTLANVYEKERAEYKAPWLAKNKNGQTPMENAMNNDDNREALEWLRSHMIDREWHSIGLLFLAVGDGRLLVAQQMWDVHIRYGWVTSSRRGQQIWRVALAYSEEVAKWVAERLTDLNLKPNEVKEALLKASEAGLEWLAKTMTQKIPVALRSVPLAWLEACERGHLSTIFAFIDNCTYFRELCVQQHTSPLHHMRLESYEQYKMLLDHPVIRGLSNFQDIYGATPLHQAIKDRDILFTEVLLNTTGINRSVKDNAGKTAMDLLVAVCHQDPQWDEMCKRNGIIPGIQITYFQDKSGLLEFRNSLSVVAALLTTITFTAGFTLPGGVKSDSNGEATLANKAVFLVFLLTDAFAMCCSMLVLICLLWSMVCDRDTSMLLVDGSMRVLMLALNSTLVAFMTGVYAVVSHKSLWVGIVILVMCSVLIISSTKRGTFKLLSMINTIKNKNKDHEISDDDIQLLEQGEASAPR